MAAPLTRTHCAARPMGATPPLSVLLIWSTRQVGAKTVVPCNFIGGPRTSLRIYLFVLPGPLPERRCSGQASCSAPQEFGACCAGIHTSH